MRLTILNRIGLISHAKKDKTFFFIKNLIGRKPHNTDLFKLAFTHKSNTTNHRNNERLEFLGDAILDSIMSDILYKRYPYKPEGELTHYRSNVVKRSSLNKIAISLGISEMLIVAPKASISIRMYGDMLEAFIGALYLDQGYRFTYHFVKDKIVDALISEEDLTRHHNYKSKLLEWGQQQRKEIQFSEEKDATDEEIFVATICIDGKKSATGKGKTKKESHNNAAHIALKELGQE